METHGICNRNKISTDSKSNRPEYWSPCVVYPRAGVRRHKPEPNGYPFMDTKIIFMVANLIDPLYYTQLIVAPKHTYQFLIYSSVNVLFVSHLLPSTATRPLPPRMIESNRPTPAPSISNLDYLQRLLLNFFFYIIFLGNLNPYH